MTTLRAIPYKEGYLVPVEVKSEMFYRTHGERSWNQLVRSWHKGKLK